MTHQEQDEPIQLRTVTGRVSARRRYSAHTILEVVTVRGKVELFAVRGGVEGIVVEGETWSFELDSGGRVAAGTCVGE